MPRKRTKLRPDPFLSSSPKSLLHSSNDWLLVLMVDHSGVDSNRW